MNSSYPLNTEKTVFSYISCNAIILNAIVLTYSSNSLLHIFIYFKYYQEHILLFLDFPSQLSHSFDCCILLVVFMSADDHPKVHGKPVFTHIRRSI